MAHTKRGSKVSWYEYPGLKVPGADTWMHHSRRAHAGANWAKRAGHKAHRRATRPDPDEVAQVMYDRYAERKLARADTDSTS